MEGSILLIYHNHVNSTSFHIRVSVKFILQINEFRSWNRLSYATPDRRGAPISNVRHARIIRSGPLIGSLDTLLVDMAHQDALV